MVLKYIFSKGCWRWVQLTNAQVGSLGKAGAVALAMLEFPCSVLVPPLPPMIQIGPPPPLYPLLPPVGVTPPVERRVGVIIPPDVYFTPLPLPGSGLGVSPNEFCCSERGGVERKEVAEPTTVSTLLLGLAALLVVTRRKRHVSCKMDPS